MPADLSRKHYRVGALYSFLTAALLAAQEPFSALAAKKLSATLFVCLSQAALLASVPLLIASASSRRDFFALFADRTNISRFAILFFVGLLGLLFYNASLSNAHPIIVAAVLNLSPLWAGVVARVISKKPFPVSFAVFFGCLAVAFIGAMTIAWSQTAGPDQPSFSELAKELFRTSWVYAIPIPVLYALSGTLIGEWFAKYDDAAAVAANFLVSAVIVIPACFILLWRQASPGLHGETATAVALLIIGTMASAAAGRVLYQVALTVTKNDNGFVTMFFLLVPGLTTLISAPLSWAIPDLHFATGPLFFGGLALVGAPLLFFSIKAWR